MQPQTRKQMITKIHIGKSALKMSDNQYKLFLLNTVDKHSCTVMMDTELMQVLQAMKAQGVVFTTKTQRRPTARTDKAPLLAKITALLTTHGLPQSYADGIAKKAFGVDFVHWLEVWQLKKVVQMLAVYHRRKQQ
ncbi:regulatory protein GemA [uncultured Haemophilus sp.]|uniref:gp16 family protein n=1 Tax=uncultured Haemophilus sp. TaxID=237779 RepID=UPI002805FDDE|nr:regulatory protein GemA [uncultured Haemophilus sp.]